MPALPVERVEHRGRVVDEVLGAVRGLSASHHRPQRVTGGSLVDVGGFAGVPQVDDGGPEPLILQALEQAFRPPEAGCPQGP